MKRFLLALFIFVTSIFIFLSSGVIESQDGQQYASVARYIYYEHWPYAPPYEYDKGLNIHMNLEKSAKDGKYYSPTGFGYTLAFLPAVVISDVLHQYYGVTPPLRFPLESDWVFHLFGSFANASFAGFFAVIFFLYLLRFTSSAKLAFVWTLITLFSTNLAAYSKHSFAQMMFTTFLFATFYFLKQASGEEKRKQFLALFLSGVMFGITILSYNPIFALATPALLWYYFLLFPLSWRKKQSWQVHLQRILAGLAGVIPFIIFYFAYNAIRFGGALDSGYTLPGLDVVQRNTLIVLFEGVWAYLFSPGRSFFLYSPLALVPLIFWHKQVWKKYPSEWKAFLALIFLFVTYNASQRGGADWFSWHGESSWGPRYLVPLIPFCMVLSFQVFQELKKGAKYFAVFPLLLFGLYVQLLGIALPYQTKFSGVAYQTYIGKERFTMWDYGNFIPRYSPLIQQTKNFLKLLAQFPQHEQHGKYNLQFYDGFDAPFVPWPNNYWRGMNKEAFASFRLPQGTQLHTLAIDFSNTQLNPVSSYSAEVSLRINSSNPEKIKIDSEKWETFHATISASPERHYELFFEPHFIGTTAAEQKIFVRGIQINGEPQPTQALDFPYTQPLASAMSGKTPQYWGGEYTDNWDLWRLRSAVYELTFDFWWLKPLYYWDLPKTFFAGLFLLNIVTLFFSGRILWKRVKYW